jgi:glycine/sarcosine N-methyltransferase
MYNSFSIDYDRFVNWPSRLAFELPFIEEQLKAIRTKTGQPLRVLDAACGTGMHAIALAQRGTYAAGADLSVGMVERARLNAASAGVGTPFLAAGFGALAQAFQAQPGFPFDALLCLGNSLPHLLTPEDLKAALHDFAACLKPGGLLLVQNRNFDAVMTGRQRWMEPQVHREGTREWIFLRFYDFEPSELIGFNILTLQREGDSPWMQTTYTSRLRPLLQTELSAVLAGVGFGEITCYGGMSGEAFDSVSSGNLVVTARRILTLQPMSPIRTRYA